MNIINNKFAIPMKRSALGKSVGKVKIINTERESNRLRSYSPLKTDTAFQHAEIKRENSFTNRASSLNSFEKGYSKISREKILSKLACDKRSQSPLMLKDYLSKNENYTNAYKNNLEECLLLSNFICEHYSLVDLTFFLYLRYLIEKQLHVHFSKICFISLLLPQSIDGILNHSIYEHSLLSRMETYKLIIHALSEKEELRSLMYNTMEEHFHKKNVEKIKIYEFLNLALRIFSGKFVDDENVMTIAKEIHPNTINLELKEKDIQNKPQPTNEEFFPEVQQDVPKKKNKFKNIIIPNLNLSGSPSKKQNILEKSELKNMRTSGCSNKENYLDQNTCKQSCQNQDSVMVMINELLNKLISSFINELLEDYADINHLIIKKVEIIDIIKKKCNCMLNSLVKNDYEKWMKSIMNEKKVSDETQVHRFTNLANKLHCSIQKYPGCQKEVYDVCNGIISSPELVSNIGKLILYFAAQEHNQDNCVNEE